MVINTIFGINLLFPVWRTGWIRRKIINKWIKELRFQSFIWVFNFNINKQKCPEVLACWETTWHTLLLPTKTAAQFVLSQSCHFWHLTPCIHWSSNMSMQWIYQTEREPVRCVWLWNIYFYMTLPLASLHVWSSFFQF